MRILNSVGEIPVVVGSKKQFKIDTASDFILSSFLGNKVKATGVATDSGVREMPTSIKETMEGASNRAISAFQRDPSANISVGLEGGVCQPTQNGPFFVFEAAGVGLKLAPDNILTGSDISDLYMLPEEFADGLNKGRFLHELVIEYVRGKTGEVIPEDDIRANGSAFYLSNGAITREGASKQALERALAKLEAQITAKPIEA